MPILLPHNVEAEQAILGASLINSGAVTACQFLQPEDFYEPVHGRIWEAMRREVAEGRETDPVTLGPFFETDPALAEMGGRKYLARLARRAESIRVAAAYGRQVRDLARRRRLALAAQALAERAADTSVAADAAEVLAEAMPQLEAEIGDDSRSRGRTLTELATVVADSILSPRPMISTGVAALDEAMGGGVPLGYVVGFEARPAGFKTGFLHSVAVNASLAKPPVPSCYFAAEMGGERLAKRMFGHIGNFKSGWFRFPDENLVSAMNRITGKLPKTLLVEDCPGVRFSRLKQMASEHLTKRGCKVFFLDYYQLVQPDGRCDNKNQHLEEVAYWVQSFAYKHGTTWFVASQQNRDGFSLGGDGLLRACDWLCQINKNEVKMFDGMLGEDVETLWLDVRKARDGSGDPVGSADKPRLFIHPHGPHLAELPR